MLLYNDVFHRCWAKRDRKQGCVNFVQGMPHKYYHGKTGVVWNVTKRAVGVEINKQVCMVTSYSPWAVDASCAWTLSAHACKTHCFLARMYAR